jgi:hypothetical protein
VTRDWRSLPFYHKRDERTGKPGTRCAPGLAPHWVRTKSRLYRGPRHLPLCPSVISCEYGRRVPADPILPLASSMHAGPGTYALLVGSGISTGTGVPTGWDVTVDLVGRLSVLLDEDTEGDPIRWYRTRAGGTPDYSQLLEELAPSPEDRRNLLQHYFEPTEGERAQRQKVPAPAHRAIASLVAGGYVRVIITPNFDRLLEQALSEAGVQASVIASAGHALGASPLVHSPCTIIKVHGDYLSPDLRNTAAELSAYDPAVDALLDQVLDQYGLVVCGWSAAWDMALREAILRNPARRYPLYFAHRGSLAPEAQELVDHRKGFTIEIDTADNFFAEIADKVRTLQDRADQNPESTSLAVAQLKRHLADPTGRIRLHDLIHNEATELIESTTGWDMQDRSVGFQQRLIDYERASARLVSILAVAAYHGTEPSQQQLVADVIERVARRPVDHGGLTTLLDLQQYPTTLLLYGVGLGALAGGRIHGLALALARGEVPDLSSVVPLAIAASSWQTLPYELLRASVPSLENKLFPQSLHLHKTIRPLLAELIPDDRRFDEVFDELEYLLGLAYAAKRGEGIGPTGMFIVNYRYSDKWPTGALERHAGELVQAGLAADEEALAEISRLYTKESVSSARSY